MNGGNGEKHSSETCSLKAFNFIIKLLGSTFPSFTTCHRILKDKNWGVFFLFWFGEKVKWFARKWKVSCLRRGMKRVKKVDIFVHFHIGFPSTSLSSFFSVSVGFRLVFPDPDIFQWTHKIRWKLWHEVRKNFHRWRKVKNQPSIFVLVGLKNTNLDRSANFSYRILSNPFSPRAFYLQKHNREKRIT